MPRNKYKDFYDSGKKRKIEESSHPSYIGHYGEVEPNKSSADVDPDGSCNEQNENYDILDDDILNVEDNYTSELRKMLRDAPTSVLLLVASSCLARLSNRDFERFLVSREDVENMEIATELWYYRKQMFSVHKFCNGCGLMVRGSQKCTTCKKNAVATFVRIGAISQIKELVETFFQDIQKLRTELRSGKVMDHNLSSKFFSKYWESETSNHLHLSFVLSIDGVNISGVTKKLWPVSLMMVDLPLGQMQKSTNIVLEGAVECSETPSTALWNSLIPMIFTDVENHIGRCNGITFDCKIATCSADQPAKRTLFGFRAHQSRLSCFYCLGEGTMYKSGGYSRHEQRRGNLTILDSENGENGFGPVPAQIVKHVFPFDTPIDLLHNLGEGLFEVIRKEIIPPDSKHIRKSDVFQVEKTELDKAFSKLTIHSSFKDIENCRNGSDKTHFFRLKLGLVALCSDVLSPKARVIIVALSMLANKMYSYSKGGDSFDLQLCASVQWMLSESSLSYMSIKAHEVICHLPRVNELFGSTGPLSTNSFESFYQFALCGYSTSTTRHFLENACTKYLLYTAIRRELRRRAEHNDSSSLKRFLTLTPGISNHRNSWKNRIPVSRLLKKETEVEEIGLYELFSSLSLPVGVLVSEYSYGDTSDDLFFANYKNQKMCFRFVFVLVRENRAQVLAEPLYAATADQCLANFRTITSVLNGTDFYYTTEVLKHLMTYDGLFCGKPSGERVILQLNDILGIGCYSYDNDNIICFQANGGFLHN